MFTNLLLWNFEECVVQIGIKLFALRRDDGETVLAKDLEHRVFCHYNSIVKSLEMCVALERRLVDRGERKIEHLRQKQGGIVGPLKWRTHVGNFEEVLAKRLNGKDLGIADVLHAASSNVLSLGKGAKIFDA